jgi:RHH-type transcriptional regulator, proline utilization regulon repressor / proline dehydrogenase / delta 1-pyrroline-5-carboxylate dehydrogenase
MSDRFSNQPTLELRRASVRESLTAALAELDRQLPLGAPVFVGAERLGQATFQSTDPGNPARVVCDAGRGSASDADTAVDTLRQGFLGWARQSAQERASVLVRAADILRGRRLQLAALQVRECAKPWLEADADVCEAIDFLNYYAQGAIGLDQGKELLQIAGERNTMRYAPCGVVAVIAPWNFPLAIPTGMCAAALAAGNTVCLKPAEQSPASAWMLVNALHEAGVPPDALALVPGYGDVGARLVSHPGVNAVAFTGSSAVGLEIIAAASNTPDEQGHIKHVVAEMGGKNCVIVDSDADLDEAVPAICVSAFGYAGQKCSAAARILCHEAAYDAVFKRLSGAVAALVVGQAESFDTTIPPVIDSEARQRIRDYAQIAEVDGNLRAFGVPPNNGWFCVPALATDLSSDSRVLSEEIFGPLVTVERVPSVEAACDVVDALGFALTGGLFSRSPRSVEMVTRRTPVGNLYVNRAITGAIVGRQPFGGNRRSGVGSKAGGPDYLVQFTEPRVVSENTTRHGLVVE